MYNLCKTTTTARLGLALAVHAALVSAAQAQNQQKVLVLEEVIVTAQKREQNSLTVPVTVDTFSVRDIEATGALRLGDMDDYIPGFEMGDGVGQQSPTIRGVSSSNISTGGDSSVAAFYDDVYLPRAATTIAFGDMARVEVLKGPQGTLFGRNALAGVINMVPNQPHGEFEGFVSARLGNYDLQRYEGMVNTPLTDNLFLRANVLYNERDSYVDTISVFDDDPGDRDHKTARVALRWEATEDTRFQLSYDYDKVDQSGRMAIGISDYSYSLDPFDYKTENDLLTGSEESRDMGAVTFKAFHDFSDQFSMKFVTSYRDYEILVSEEEDGTNEPTVYTHTDHWEDSDIFYNELQFSWVTDSFDMVFGANYSKETIDSSETFTALGDSVARLATDQVNDLAGTDMDHMWNADEFADALNTVLGTELTEEDILSSGDAWYNLVAAAFEAPEIFGPSLSYANSGATWDEGVFNEGEFVNWGVYGDIDFSITDRWNLILGLRYSRDDKDFEWLVPPTTFTEVRPGVSNVIYNAEVGFPELNTVIKADDSWDKWTGRVVANYQVTDDAMVFASYSTGYKSGGFDSLNGNSATDPIEPEDATSYELGLKGDFFDRSVRTQVALFYNEVDNRQRSVDSKPPGQEIALPKIINGNQEFTGVELTLDWIIIDTVQAGLVTTYREVDEEWEFFYDSQGEPSEEGGSGHTDNTYTITFDWTPAIPVGEVQVHLDYIFREDSSELDPNFVDGFGDIKNFGDDKKLLNGRVSWISDDGSYELALWGRNLLDNEYVGTPGGRTAAFFGTYHTSVDEPLMWGVDLKYSF